jgi:hypothetical protein
MADGDALHVTRTKAFSAVGIQKTLEKRLGQSFFQYYCRSAQKAVICLILIWGTLKNRALQPAFGSRP